MKSVPNKRHSTSQPRAAKSCQDASKRPGELSKSPTWPPEVPRQLQDGPGSVQDASSTPSGPLQELPRRLQDDPRSAQEASKTRQRPPSLLWELPRRFQELSRGGIGASKTPPTTLQRRLRGHQDTSKTSPGVSPKPPAAVQQPQASWPSSAQHFILCSCYLW